MNDLDLLRLYEPICYYTQGEMFYPVAVDEYLKRASLWQRDRFGQESKIADVGELTADNIGDTETTSAKHRYFLRFVQDPLDIIDYRQWLQTRPAFQAHGRLSRVNLFSRLLDSFFDLSLAIRGTVPGGTTASAELLYQDMRKADPNFTYYGRVLHEGGYIILHYVFFYVMNDWRSSFYGVNDHEADWEQVFVYLSDEGDNEPIPRWVAFAAHDFTGDDLRRRWDDPELQRVGTHPIVYVGAGSHASYFVPGEYLTQVEPAFLKPVTNLLQGFQTFWRDVLQQGDGEITERFRALLRVPFIDYARGDGIHIGFGQQRTWTPILLHEDMPWVTSYRGLWGLDTNDFMRGERAPGGVKFNRDGAVRQSWADPLGWSGLDKVTPPNEALKRLREKIMEGDAELILLDTAMAEQRDLVRDLALEVEALALTDYRSVLFDKRQADLDIEQAQLQAYHQQIAELAETQRALRIYLAQLEAGNLGEPRTHIAQVHPPEPPLPRQTRLLELWATFSGVLLVIVLIILLSLPNLRQFWLIGGALVILAFFIIEATLRGRLVWMLLNITIVLAIITTFILLFEFWLVVLILALSTFVAITFRENLRELRRL